METEPTNAQVDKGPLVDDRHPVTQLIRLIGENPTREGLLDTPRRVLKSHGEIFKGYQMDPKVILSTCFDSEGYDQMVLLKDIELYSTCEHHMLPFFGKAHVAYIPNKKVVGLSKLARLVECYSRRLQIQERLTNQIADAIVNELDPIGVGVVIEAKHFCMVMRGVNKQNSVMKTSALRGALKINQSAREEFLGFL
jgi:GTP cyclohydrolase I